jgi:hypothetical protein
MFSGRGGHYSAANSAAGKGRQPVGINGMMQMVKESQASHTAIADTRLAFGTPAAPFDPDRPDPLAELERLIVDNTCEWCGETKLFPLDSILGRNKHLIAVAPHWCCLEEKKNGYTSKHWKVWRVCAACRSGGTRFGTWFGRWASPVIAASMPPHDLVSQFLQVQPMQVPQGQVFYMDFVHGAPTPPDAEVRVQLPDLVERVMVDNGLAANPVRGRLRHGLIIENV